MQLLGAAREQKKVYESSLVQKERQITKLDTAFKTASQEVLKVGVPSTLGRWTNGDFILVAGK